MRAISVQRETRMTCVLSLLVSFEPGIGDFSRIAHA